MSFDVDQVDFTFFNSAGDEIGTESLNPALGSSGGIEAEDIPLVSPLNTRSVTAFLTGTNGQVDFQNIGFTANVSDPEDDPDLPAPIPLPAAMWLMAGGLGALAMTRRKA